jgi:hypothetical protein
VIQAPRKSNGVVVSYEHAELELAKIQLARVRLWAIQGFKETGSDGLFAILREKV